MSHVNDELSRVSKNVAILGNKQAASLLIACNLRHGRSSGFLDEKSKVKILVITAMAGAALIFVGGAQADHGDVASSCTVQFNDVHTDIDSSGASLNDRNNMLLKLAAAVAKFGEDKDGDAIQKLEDIGTKVDRLLAGNNPPKKIKIDPDGAGDLIASLTAAADCIIGS